MTQNRSKAALFRNKIGAVKEWIVEGYGLEAISEMLKSKHEVDLSAESLRKYIRREFNCGLRELKEKLSHEKNNMSEQRPISGRENASLPDTQAAGSKPHEVVQSPGEKDEETGLNTLLNANDRQAAVSTFFSKKPK